MRQSSSRTLQQNKSLHVLFTQVAQALNDAGLDYRAVMAENPASIPWSPALVKELWKAMQELQLGKPHTAELTTGEVDEVYDTFNRFLAEFGVHVPFPSLDEQRVRSLQ